jgi:catechol 2,3-dioxygenase-like lactoylglutathione lyase family enzyme
MGRKLGPSWAKASRRAHAVSSARPNLAFNHAMIYVREVDLALRFYRDLLGFRVISQMEGYARLRSPRGSTTIALHQYAKPPPKTRSGPPTHRLYFEVSGLDAFCKRLKARGVKFDAMPKAYPWGWRHAYLRDPDGHELSLYQAGAKRLRPP